MAMKTLKDFLIDQLCELYNAELQLKMLIDEMAFKTSNEDLRHSFEHHSKKADGQLVKLDRVFHALGLKMKQRYSEIAKAIGNEIHAFIETNPSPEVLDAGFIAMFQKGKHYEIALYGTLREFAAQLQNREAEGLLSALLEEEKEEDRVLTDRARGGVNERASGRDSEREHLASSGRKA
jgi:ferritin-like metal-binding protein YciE